MFVPNHFSAPVLLVDDDAVSRALLSDHLTSAGYAVRDIESAEEALAIVGRGEARMIIADWLMPGMSGLELCRRVRELPLAPQPHFVMLTVYAEKPRVIEAFDAGVDDFLSKPVNEDELLARLRAWNRLIRLQDDLAEQNLAAAAVNRKLSSLNAKLSELAMRDELTNLPNRREAMRRLGEAWVMADRCAGNLSCAVVDIDHFKRFNDEFGHATGDEVLRHVANLLRKTLRDTDEVFRLGGDEFLLIFPDQPLAGASACASRCVELVRGEVCHFRGADLSITVSAGVAERRPSMSRASALLDAADASLYAAKAAGRDVFKTQPPCARVA
jgi:two-component system, cell cycle response regulator